MRLKPTSSQTVGPFFHDGLMWLNVPDLAAAASDGERIEIEGPHEPPAAAEIDRHVAERDERLEAAPSRGPGDARDAERRLAHDAAERRRRSHERTRPRAGA